jgi:hypothetical protein
MVPPAFRFGKREKFPLRSMTPKALVTASHEIRPRDAEAGFKYLIS